MKHHGKELHGDDVLSPAVINAEPNATELIVGQHFHAAHSSALASWFARLPQLVRASLVIIADVAPQVQIGWVFAANLQRNLNRVISGQIQTAHREARTD